ncbi:GATA type transcriptional activator of nitrogen-regulated proteins [Coemansia sp. RSA 552]|nr:GATA type transcriptional activator of nitrogen-regulated proteins [Coemansia sp. RSA 552]
MEKQDSRLSISALLHPGPADGCVETKATSTPPLQRLSPSTADKSPEQQPTKQAAISTTRPHAIACMNCKTTTTPLWRRDPSTGAHLCNRCGLYLKTYNVMHPLTRIKRRAITTQAGTQGARNKAGADSGLPMDDVEQIPRPANCSPPQLQLLDSSQPRRRRVTPKQQISLGITPRCFNCNAENTPLWRRDPADNIICNACGLYYKLHNVARPVSMKRAAIKRRNRAAPLPANASVPTAAEPGAVATPMAMPLAATFKPAGLECLVRAAELGQKAPPVGQEGAECSMLDSLAAAAAKMAPTTKMAPTAKGDLVDRKKLQLECQRLELLLAQSKAVLSTLD